MRRTAGHPRIGSTSRDRLTWVGHSTVLLEVGGARLLTDPLLRNHLGHLRRHGRPPARHVTERLDAVLISHLHFDHLDLASLRLLPRDVLLVLPRGAARLLRRKGFTRVEEVGVGERLEVAGVPVLAVPADHDGRRLPLGGAEAETLGFIVGEERRTYFAGDTDIYDEMAALGPLDVALLPIWGWGPSLGPGHLDPAGAARAAALLAPRVAVPIHWGTFFPRVLHRYRGERLTGPPYEFATALAGLAPSVDVRVLAPGESLELA
jgi:L-ascorbate metabolism protein UlaG (beta-lactamase superfamily)